MPEYTTWPLQPVNNCLSTNSIILHNDNQDQFQTKSTACWYLCHWWMYGSNVVLSPQKLKKCRDSTINKHRFENYRIT
jgi:hypothetical protein